MKGFVMIAQSAVAHGDGTFSTLLCGIRQLASGLDKPIRGTVVAFLDLEKEEAIGSKSFRIMIESTDDEPAGIKPLSGSFTISEPSDVERSEFIFPFSLRFARYGKYKFKWEVDGELIDECTLSIEPVS